MRAVTILASALSLSSLAIASSSSLDGPVEVGPIPYEEYLVRRQNTNNNNNNNNDNSANQQSSSAPASSAQNEPSATITTPPQSSGGNNNSGGDNKTSKGSDGGSGSGSNQASATSLAAIDPQAPAGGAAMITPAATSGVPYYKVDDTITWVWNYTSLARNPAAIDILASYQATNGVAPSPFTLAVNQSWEATQTFKWDTGKYTSESSPLPIGTYTLVIYDANAPGGVSATASPGHLGSWEQFTFGMYTKQAGTVDVTGAVVCTTCNSAAGLQKFTYGALLTMAGITVTTFTWFTGGFAGLW